MKNKDNPVPSLSEQERYTIIQALKNYNKEMCGDDDIVNLIEKLNGVETDKEQPRLCRICKKVEIKTVEELQVCISCFAAADHP